MNMEEKKFKCPDCEKEFPSRESMMQHNKDVHPVAEEKIKKPVSKSTLVTYALIAVVILVIVVMAYWLLSNNTNISVSISSLNLSSIPYEGNASAKINIIEFGDYQCPVCAIFSVQTEPQLLKDYVDSGKARFYFIDFSFLGPDSITLAEGAWCANEQNHYYDYHDFVYANQGGENTGWATPDKLKSFATGITGLNTEQFNSCLDSNKYRSKVQEDSAIASNSGVQGTPAFFIGNPSIGYVHLAGNQRYDVFAQTIDSQLSKAS